MEITKEVLKIITEKHENENKSFREIAKELKTYHYIVSTIYKTQKVYGEICEERILKKDSEIQRLNQAIVNIKTDKEKQISTKEEMIQQLKQEIKTLSTEKRQLKQEIAEKENEIQQLKQQLTQKTEQAEKLNQEIKKGKAIISQQKEVIEELEGQKKTYLWYGIGIGFFGIGTLIMIFKYLGGLVG